MLAKRLMPFPLDPKYLPLEMYQTAQENVDHEVDHQLMQVVVIVIDHDPDPLIGTGTEADIRQNVRSSRIKKLGGHLLLEKCHPFVEIKIDKKGGVLHLERGDDHLQEKKYQI